ncbi:HAMP domain-containing sensor histidine kinase [Tsuneonella suprasediminis]|uniref:sensor histidine kinase n=1 Tax=Tsuneonella suprasediminis TaxID=2306996 RepID=UPI002F94661C
MGRGISVVAGAHIIIARRSIFTHIVFLSAILSAVLLLGLWWVTDQTIRETLATSTRNNVDVDLAGLVDIHASGGRAELERRIADRLAVVPVDGSRPHYLLADAKGGAIAGDIQSWPALDPAISESGTIPIGDRTQAYARATLIAPGLRLLVAHEPLDEGPLLARVATVFLLGGAIFVACIALFAQAASGRVRQRVSQVSSAFRASDDDALKRLTMPDRPDEIDRIASQAADAIKRARQLSEANRETSEQIAHEIRTPLMHLDTRLVKALKQQGGDPATAAHLAEARGEIRRLVGTLEALLDIASSKARTGDSQGMKPVDLSTMVSGICELYADSAEEAGYDFQWQIAPDVTMIGDAAQLGRIVTNLLDNAFKYNRDNGAIRVELAPGPVLTVSDDGPGIPDADHERVFDRFYRGKAASGDQSGSGLGLALARAIAVRHGLHIHLAAGDGGARFVVEPASEDAI